MTAPKLIVDRLIEAELKQYIIEVGAERIAGIYNKVLGDELAKPVPALSNRDLPVTQAAAIFRRLDLVFAGYAGDDFGAIVGDIKAWRALWDSGPHSGPPVRGINRFEQSALIEAHDRAKRV